MTTVRLRTPVGMTVVMCMAEAFSMSGFACYTTLLPELMKEWTLSNAEAGLIGGIFYSGYMVAVPVLSSLTDRIDSRRIYVFACALSVLGAACFALFAQGLWSALLCQFVIGAGLPDLAPESCAEFGRAVDLPAELTYVGHPHRSDGNVSERHLPDAHIGKVFI